MAETAKSLENIIKELPPDIKQEVRDFVEFLLVRRGIKSCRGKPKFGWAGALKDLRNQYTSVELQHKISEWRIGGG
ncbi:MAG: DUF2281 domain-containing protein [Nitrospirota bacterium]|jgi:hypothetical protein